MFNSLLEDVLQPWQAVCCHNVFDITTHQNLLQPSSTFHSLHFIATADAHWSWQIILFIIEHYPVHSIIRFISCPVCLCQGIWTDIKIDIKETIQPDSHQDNICEEHFIWEGDVIYIFCVWQKHLSFSWWCRPTSSYKNMGADSKQCLTFDLKPADHFLTGPVNASRQVKVWKGWSCNSNAFQQLHKWGKLQNQSPINELNH